MKKSLHQFLISAALFAALPVMGGDKEATSLFTEGRNLYLAEDYYKAAGKFEDAFIEAENPAIRANSLLGQIETYRMCGLHYKEFQAIESLLSRYPDYGNYKKMTDREFEIAAAFYAGHRDPSFWYLRWIPWLTDPDRMEEILLAALKHAPYAPQAPRARLALAIHYEMEGMTKKSLEQLRELLKNHPDSPQSKYAMLGLAGGLFELAAHGDGDGRYINEATEEFRKFLKKYPDATQAERDLAARRIAKARDIQAKRLLEIAEYYRKNGRSEASERYLAQITQLFPDSESAPDAERELVQLSRTYLPGDFQKPPEARLNAFPTFVLPESLEKRLVSPGRGNAHFLQPVPDLKGELIRPEEREAKEEK